MKKSNLNEVNKSFIKQADNFDSQQYHLSKTDYLKYVIGKTAPQKTENVLEVAAGTCICGRAFAPYVSHVVCLDATEAMLEKGRKECQARNIKNITMVKGIAEELPFLDNSFDIVVSRLAFHHIPNYKAAFKEMSRVLSKNGKIVLIDMIPADENLRNKIDTIEKMRDSSHEYNLTKKEMQELFEENRIRLELQEETEIPVNLENWMSFTKTDDKTKSQIRVLMKDDIDGNQATGFKPYLQNGEIFFNHHWILNVGTKLES